MCAKVMVLASKISFKTTPKQDQLTGFPNQTLFDITDDGLVIDTFQWFEEDVFNASINDAYNYCNDVKLKLKGNMLTVRREGEDTNDVTNHCIKFGAREVTDTQCTFNISCRKQGEKKKALTIDEKIALYEEYWAMNHEVPPPKEVYKNLRIGAFYSTCRKNGDVMQTLNDIENENKNNVIDDYEDESPKKGSNKASKKGNKK